MISNLRKTLVSATALLLVFAVILTTADSSEARRRRKHHSRAKKRAVINEPDLYQRIGGSKGVSDLVDEWVRAALADGRLSSAFGDVTTKPAAVTKLRKDLVQEICELSDGPCKGDSKKQSDAFTLPDEKFVVLADHLVRSMDKMKIREREKNELLGRIGEIRVDDPTTAPDTAVESDDSDEE